MVRGGDWLGGSLALPGRRARAGHVGAAGMGRRIVGKYAAIPVQLIQVGIIELFPTLST
jgi:hypothetical protein